MNSSMPSINYFFVSFFHLFILILNADAACLSPTTPDARSTTMIHNCLGLCATLTNVIIDNRQ